MNWNYFNKFENVDEIYLPRRGEGDTMATQICTAVNKLIYKWYNDGDVYDNTHYLEGWCNDLSSYANWLYKHTPIKTVLERIATVYNDEEYENTILVPMADMLLNKSFLDGMNNFEKTGSIYKCDGPFQFKEYEIDVEDEDDEEDDEDEEYDD